MRLYKMELYKLCCRKVVWISMLSILGILILYFYFVNIGSEQTTINGKTYTGYQAIQTDKMITEEFRGNMTDDTAEQIIEKYGFPTKVEEYYGGFRDANYLTGFVTEYLGNGYFRDWNDYKISTALRPIAQSSLGEAAEENGSQIIFAYAKGWMVFLELLQLGMVLGSILLIICIAPVFAEEHQNKMSAMLFTTQEGKQKDVTAKIAAAFTQTALIYAVIAVCVFLMVKVVYGLDGAECMSGIVRVRSLNPANIITMKPVWYFFCITMMVDYLAFMSLCAIVLCVSAHLETSFHALAMSGIVWVFPVLIRIMFGGAGYWFSAGTPIFLIMSNVVEEWYDALFIPAAAAIGISLLCIWNSRRTYTASETISCQPMSEMV